ncbi:PSD1 and planctomycete cytochrome C domain-containing protein [Stieleria mannarensis]|uniref:PSD1 and planctomycete cytochrome C domain-containing protein n=1 Tax=Stieleria mannarensis TaxID=2755585 RepID=UPI00256FA69D|nr:PSD1 and planctomycete cytochrome C domain-containing protein [Rhodopirellula sp. JC639]
MSTSDWKPAIMLRCILLLCFIVLPQALRGEEIDFEEQILPILEDRCLYCHGEDEQESGLRLDLRARMLRGGDSGLPAVVPGKPDKSYLVEVINHVDEDMAMPPDDDKLPAEEIDLLTRWIQAGAVVPGQMEDVASERSDHWAFQSVVRPEVPSIDGVAAAPKTLSVIDAFLLRSLADQGLSYSPPADPRSLIRRVSIVLTGIAPTPEQTDAFIEASKLDSEQAYTELVDRLLQSPHFGERWAQHWLDVIRWAETNGSEANLYRKNAWIYRDYVVRSFNEDKPYDEFVQEQIAGDSMGAGEATGFLVAGPHVPAATVGREPAAIRQARADRMDEIMQTVGASVMGVTIGCARCHNHKFDPITIQDYYSMTGVFQDVEFGSRYPEFAADHPRRQRGEAIWKEIAKQRRVLRQAGSWEENWGAFREMHFQPITTTAIRVRFKMANVGLDELEVFGPENYGENLAHKRRGTKVSGFPEDGFEGRNPIRRVNDGEYGTMTWRAKTEKDAEQKPYVRFDFEHPETISRIRLSSNREYYFDTDYLDKKPYLPRYEYDVDIMKSDGSWQPWVGTWHTNTQLDKDHPERKPSLKKIQNQIDLLSEEGPRPSFVGRFVRPDVTRVLLRGSPENPRDEVDPAGPAIFGGDLGLTQQAPGPKRRAEFAKWITSEENPLTARVMVNRLWHHVFGAGIVTTTSDFGTAGAAPTHPELLDWLAAEFVDPTDSANAAWSTKAMIRQMVLSAAFRQSSAPRPEGLAKDAGSALLWRFPPKRVEAEVIRDSILQASGSLDRTIGGRSYRIHNEKKTYAQWEVVKNYGPETWRRMLYQERMRRVDDQMFTAFDFPDCGQVRDKRPVSTTPLQALNLMNSDFVISQSELIAERAERESGAELKAAVIRCFELLLVRQPEPDELNACLEMARQTSLSLVCRTLLNTNEFAFLP